MEGSFRFDNFDHVNAIKKYWGYIVVVLVVYGWTSESFSIGALALLSGIAFVYTLFQAPVWCCAQTRQGVFCRNNAGGVLRGCWIREHRWQKMRMLAKTDNWKRLFSRLFSGVNGATATISAMGTFCSGLAALAGLAVK